MLDIRFIKENVGLVKDNIKKKFQNNKLVLVDKAIKLYDEWRSLKTEVDNLRGRRNKVSEEINQLKKQNKDISKVLKEIKEIPEKIKSIEAEADLLYSELIKILMTIPNIMHKSVPIGENDTKNVASKFFGKATKFKFLVKNHVELVENLGVGDFESSARIAGKGFYFIQGQLAQLNQALLHFGVDFMIKRGFTLIEPPLMVNRKVIDGVMSFKEIDNMIYKVENEDLYMIGTSEHSIIGKFIDQTILEDQLPIKLVGISACMRKEVGSHGINEKGLWRTHQFNKVEQIVICKPKDSEKYYNEILKNSIDLYKALKIPTRQLEICSGDLGDLKHKQADIEAYRPTIKGYGEVGSCSNLTEAQARRLNIKIIDKQGNKVVAHTLNNTAIATSRAMVAIIENNQQKDGSIKVPAVLKKYTGFSAIKK